MEKPSKADAIEIQKSIQELNDIYFDIVKMIYSANFAGAKQMFFETNTILGRIIQYSQVESLSEFGMKSLDLVYLNQLIEKAIGFFEQNNPQALVDLLLFDFSAVLNEYADELDKI